MGLDPAKVAAELGIAVDDRVTSCTSASEAWVEARRCLDDPAELWLDSGVERGGILYACLLYQQRAQPQGFDGMDALGTFAEDQAALMSQVYRLVGASAVIA